ncbi:MAG: alpha-mannosidase, partial [Clostridiales bacterium]|nr:alpha-mannosidase [Clostridiales bacterium]
MQKRKLHLIGNAHLDPAWLWTWREGYAEVKATFRSALDRMNEFPEFCFTCAGAAYYSWVGESDPGMLEEIRERVKEGRWVIAGGWWIQPDCNAPCGESFARHSLYGQRLFLEMFGVTAKTGYNVDSFGHNAMLPQILKLSGMDSYVFMRPGDMEKDLPSLFWWESDDGSRVMAHRLPFSYSLWYEGYEGDPDDPEFRSKPMIERKLIGTKRLSEKLETDLMAFYGVGNHGGGPTIENLKLLNRLKSDPKWSDLLVFSSPDLYFKEQDGLGIPVVHSDLLHHAMGCYSANSEIKALNRRAEHRVLAGEKFAAMAYAMLGLDYPFDVIKKAWTYIMFNQFHDIMGGCCIKEASRDAIESFGASLSISAEVSNLALQKIAWAIDTMGGSQASVDKEKGWMLWELEDKGAPLIVFNPLSWPVSASIQAGLDVSGVTNEKGEPIPIQKVRGQKTNFSDKWDTLFIGDIPAMGYRVYWINSSAKAAELLIKSKAEAQGLVLENQFIRLELDELTGHIKSLKDKKTGLEFIKGHGAVPVSIDESDCDTWAHGKARFSGETQ